MFVHTNVPTDPVTIPLFHKLGPSDFDITSLDNDRITIGLSHMSCVFHSKSGIQILTQEDWNIVLFNGMERTSHWAALYFVALMTFGNYVLFNLLVAILVEGFSAESWQFAGFPRKIKYPKKSTFGTDSKVFNHGAKDEINTWRFIWVKFMDCAF
ncbi:voltage-dependent T-type calcium channel subunit alpha-1H [Trichonephila inaurata madagascariensis]|uniref:Voltage-dependent T-type calcium channel subunit alpha-1H n=1 Tax=Trichonephila inaurata madagascariensis TaxID=2747483 RepID=A0A8X6XVK1_9ARAC|nr:voltage-dependent T-type calcium channel subunit alpha-1H [Trichonephila inaurata madagascariensis]